MTRLARMASRLALLSVIDCRSGIAAPIAFARSPLQTQAPLADRPDSCITFISQQVLYA
jgi:hypothetical protein